MDNILVYINLIIYWFSLNLSKIDNWKLNKNVIVYCFGCVRKNKEHN